MTRIREVNPWDIRVEVSSLLEMHSQELNLDKELQVLNPDWEMYRLATDLGKMFTLEARVNGVLVGYSANVLQNHPHYKDLRVSSNDVLFLHPDYRGSSVGGRLLLATERTAKEHGAQAHSWHAKPGTALDAILSNSGYRVQDIIYTKRL